MRMTGVTGLAIVMALLMVNLAFAESCEDYCDPGWYLILGGLTAWDQFQDTEEADIGTSLGFELRGGYRVLKYFAAEGQIDFLSGFRLRTGDPDVGDLEIDGTVFTANAKGYLPFERFQPYGLVGLGGMYARVRTAEAVGTICSPGFYGWWCSGVYGQLEDGADFVARLGGGFDIFLTENIAINLDASYLLPFDKLSELRYISFNWGAKFKF
jgi:opacity protein-like surface antigen